MQKPANAIASTPRGDIEVAVDPRSVGMHARKLRRAAERFRGAQTRGVFPGGQLVVRRRGHLVLDEFVGLARGLRAEEGVAPVAVSGDTRFQVFSAAIPVLGICAAILEARGLLDVNAPIADYLPEFATNGKEQITTLDVLTHRAGIVMPELAAHPEDWSNWERVRLALRAASPSYPRGTLVYQPLEFGWILAHLVESVAGQPLPDFVAAEIEKPLGVGAMGFGAPHDDGVSVARMYWLGRAAAPASHHPAGPYEQTHNSRGFLDAFAPAAGLLTNARTLALFYDMLLAGGQVRSGERLLPAASVITYTTADPHEDILKPAGALGIGRGFLLGGAKSANDAEERPRLCFGQAGAFSALAFGDPRSGVSFAAVTNGNRGPMNFMALFMPLAALVRSAALVW